MFKELMRLVEKRDQLKSAIEAGYVDRAHTVEVEALSRQIDAALKGMR